MKLIARLAALTLAAASAFAAAPAVKFQDHLGIQLWSLRAQFKEKGAAALDLVQGYGLTEVETFGVPGLTAAQLAEELKKRGLRSTAAHMGVEGLRKDLKAAIADAKALGVMYVIVPALPHKNGFKEEDALKVAEEFNRYGQAFKEAGIRFGYHPHGFEFTATKAGGGEVVFDVLARATKPELVCYEMDVFWVTHAGQDPVKLLRKYPDRWVALHVKDMRKGTVTGLSTGSAAPTDNVAVGQGQLDWPAILRTAQDLGIRHYFIEDETPTPLQCIPDSLKYVRGLKL